MEDLMRYMGRTFVDNNDREVNLDIPYYNERVFLSIPNCWGIIAVELESFKEIFHLLENPNKNWEIISRVSDKSMAEWYSGFSLKYEPERNKPKPCEYKYSSFKGAMHEAMNRASQDKYSYVSVKDLSSGEETVIKNIDGIEYK